MPSTTALPSSVARTQREELRTSAIPDTNFDGSKLRSTFWFSVLPLLLMAATFPIVLLFSNFSPVAGAVGFLVLCALISYFPSQASSRFITANFKRPIHFIPSVVSLVVASFLAIVGALNSDLLTPMNITAQAAGTLGAFFVAVTITTSGRYAMNYIAMTQRLFVVLACWGGSSMVVDQTLLAVGVVGLSLDVLWHIQSRWVPMVETKMPVAH